MRHIRSTSRSLRFGTAIVALTGGLLASCAAPLPKDELEGAKNTFACLAAGERIVIRLDLGEARLLMPDGDRVVLYQISAESGVRYSNGNLELRGTGMALQLIRNGAAMRLADCHPIQAPK